MSYAVKLGTPLGLAARRLWSRRGRVAVAALGAAAAAAVLATVLASGLTVADRTLARRISGLSPDSRSVAAVWAGLALQQPRGGFRALDRLVRKQLQPLTGRRPAPFLLYRETRVRTALVDLAAGDDLGRWIRLRSGRLPRVCTARRCEVVQLAGSGPVPAPLVRVGEGSLTSSAPFGDLLGAQTTGSLLARAERFHRPAAPPFVVAEGVDRAAALPGLGYDFRSYRWIVPLQPGDVHPWNEAAFTRRLDEARAALGTSSQSFTLEAPESELAAATATGRAGQRRLLLLGGEAAALLLAFTLLAASELRRDAEANRRRLTWLGATRSQLALESGAEAAGIAAVGTIAGWLVGIVPALLVARHFGSPGSAIVGRSVLSGEGLAVAIGLAVLAMLVLLLAIGAPELRLGSRRVSALDIAALGAALAIALLYSRGATDTSSLESGRGTSAMLLLLPGLVVFLAAVLAARAVGVLPRLLERLGRKGSVSLRLALLSLARNPGRASIAVAFLVVSLGLGLFAAVYRSTLIRGQHDQAAFAVPAAAIVSEDFSKLVPVLRAAPLQTYRGTGPATPVVRLTGNVPAGLPFTLLAMPAGAVRNVDGWRSDFSSSSLADLGTRIAPGGPVALRGPLLRPGRLTFPHSSRGLVRVRAAVELPDESFRFVQLPGRVPRSRLVGLSFDVTNRGVEREAISGESAHPLGTVTIRLGAPHVDGKPVSIDYGAWLGTGGVRVRPARGAATLRFLGTSDAQPGFRPRQPLDGRPVPLVASPAIAAAADPTGLLPLEIEGTRVLTRVVGGANAFPSVSGDVVLADRQTLSTALNTASPGAAVTNEIWLDRTPPSGPPFAVLRVQTRTAVERHLETDPLARGSLLALVVSAVGALALALAGLLLVLLADLRDERGELFDLEAQGAGPATLRTHLRLRALVVVALGLAGGIAAGAALSALVVSLVKVTANASEPQPPLVTSVDWRLLAVGLAIYLLAACAVAGVLTWRAFRAPVAGRYAELGW